MVAKTLIAALAVAQKKEAEARAKRNNPEEFKRRFRLVFGKDRPTTGTKEETRQEERRDEAEDTTIWEDETTGEAPPERLPDNATITDGAESGQGGPATPSDDTGKGNIPPGGQNAPGGVQKPPRAKAKGKGKGKGAKPPKRKRKGSRK